jgi:hypothetical protein
VRASIELETGDLAPAAVNGGPRFGFLTFPLSAIANLGVRICRLCHLKSPDEIGFQGVLLLATRRLRSAIVQRGNAATNVAVWWHGNLK